MRETRFQPSILRSFARGHQLKILPKEAAGLLRNFLPRSYAALTLFSRNVENKNAHVSFLYLQRNLTYNLRHRGIQTTVLSMFEIFGTARNHGKSSQNWVRPPLAISSIITKYRHHIRKSVQKGVFTLSKSSFVLLIHCSPTALTESRCVVVLPWLRPAAAPFKIFQKGYIHILTGQTLVWQQPLSLIPIETNMALWLFAWWSTAASWQRNLRLTARGNLIVF